MSSSIKKSSNKILACVSKYDPIFNLYKTKSSNYLPLKINFETISNLTITEDKTKGFLHHFHELFQKLLQSLLNVKLAQNTYTKHNKK